MITPPHLGEYPVDPVTPLDDDEEVWGWVDEYGTITNQQGERLGDLIELNGEAIAIIVRKKQ